jgi:hypothetical protein
MQLNSSNWGGGGGVFKYKLLQDTELGAFHIARKQRQVTDSYNYVSTAEIVHCQIRLEYDCKWSVSENLEGESHLSFQNSPLWT